MVCKQSLELQLGVDRFVRARSRTLIQNSPSVCPMYQSREAQEVPTTVGVHPPARGEWDLGKTSWFQRGFARGPQSRGN